MVEMCVTHIPSPIDNAQRKVENIYTGVFNNSTIAQDMFTCNPKVFN